MNKKNVLVLATSFPRWPQDHLTAMFLFELSKRHAENYNIFFLVPHTKGVKFKEVWQNVTIYRFRYFWPEKLETLCYGSGIIPNLKKNHLLYLILPFLFFFQFINICLLIKKEKIDIVHAQWFFPSGLTASVAAKIFHKPLIFSSHGPDILNLSGVFWDKIRRFVIKQANLVTVISPLFIKNLIDLYPPVKDKIFSISMGIDANLFFFQPHRNNNKEPKLLFVGRLSPVKGVNYLIRALPGVLEKFSKVRLEIIGYGAQEKELKALVKNLSLENKITFIGPVPNRELPKYYQHSFCYILPSIVEGLPVAIMEAMACGCPVIATSVGGVRDLIENNVTGLLISPKSVDEISQSVIRLLSDKILRENIIQNARKKIEENYEWNIIASKFEKLYDKVSVK